MKTLKLDEYRDKVMGCWTGKNIGGVLGAPFEGTRQYLKNVDFYQQDLTQGPPANDDLDLQIVTLAAVERYGRNVDASILGEYWLSYVIPNWVEYGMAKANLRAGILPPLSGYIDNIYRNSNGAWIRSEIWACLAPGHPEIAARYAYEDAVVDHAEEGMYGEIFTAALESAAFAESDKFRLIDIALSYIPETSLLFRCIKKVEGCYANHIPFREARIQIHNCAPGTFGIQSVRMSEIHEEEDHMAIGEPGMDCPENIAFSIAGWLYGGDDFGKCITLANACGEDTDCTAAMLGAVMGIILGEKKIPVKWKEPLNDRITTMCIDKTSHGLWVPTTVTELADRVIRVMPSFLGVSCVDIFDPSGLSVSCREGEELFSANREEFLPNIKGDGRTDELPLRKLSEMSPWIVRKSFPAMTVLVDYGNGAFFRTDRPKKIRVIVLNAGAMKEQQWVRIKIRLPAGVSAVSGTEHELPLNNLHGSKAEAQFIINSETFTGGRIEAVICVSLTGRHSFGVIPVILFRDPNRESEINGNRDKNEFHTENAQVE